MSTFDLVLPRAYGAKHAAPARAGDGEEKDEMSPSFVFSLTSRSQCRALVLGYRARAMVASVAVPSYLSAGLLACMLAFAVPVAAQVIGDGDYVLDQRVRSSELQSCVASGVYDVAGRLRAGMFFGSGLGFTGNGQEIVFLTNSGAEFVVATGLNSIGDCAYDAGADVLYVSDNGLEALGSISGDTLFAIADASTASAVSVAGLELLTVGDIGAAAGVAIDSAGAVYVSDSIGGGSGRVLKIDTGGVSEWITGLDFASGLAFNAVGELFVAETSSSTFESTVRRYDSAGSLIGAFSGPTFAHGSFDLAFNPAGTPAGTQSSSADLLVSGSPSVVSLDTAAVTTTFASGFGFSTGISADPITFAVAIVSSAFPSNIENRTLFRFTPRSELVAGKGGAKGECIAEISGVKLVAKKPGKKPKDARCADGDPACDADGAINGACLFRFGLCLNVADPDLPACFASRVDTIDVSVRPKKLPLPASLAQWNAELVAALPVTSETCSESDGVEVVLRQNKKGQAKPGKLRIKVEVRRGDAKPKKDTDKIKLVCLPAGA